MEKGKNVYQKESLLQLGLFLNYGLKFNSWPGYKCGISENEFNYFKASIKKASQENLWFTEEMINNSLENWSNNLTEDNIDVWLSKYKTPSNVNKNVLIICAGNLPLVGLHDVLCCVVLGLNVQVKLSKKDDVLLPLIINLLSLFDENIKKQVVVLRGKPKNFDAVIATGSDNSNRYFDYYFGEHPHIFRKNRTSVAVIHDDISDDQLLNLSHDILQYYGLGCRSVTKLYLPENFDIDKLYKNFFYYKDLVNHNKYMNNYDYNRSIFLLEKKLFFDNGFLILKEDKNLFSPISVVNFEYYYNLEDLETELNVLSNQIQCRVGVGGLLYGNAQKPNLWDYADGVDTMDFLTNF